MSSAVSSPSPTGTEPERVFEEIRFDAQLAQRRRRADEAEPTRAQTAARRRQGANEDPISMFERPNLGRTPSIVGHSSAESRQVSGCRLYLVLFAV